MRQMLRFIAWLVAALFCVVATVIFSYGVTILASIAFRFSFVDDPAAVTWLYGSMAVFAIISLAFLMFLIIKMTKNDSRSILRFRLPKGDMHQCQLDNRLPTVKRT